MVEFGVGEHSCPLVQVSQIPMPWELKTAPKPSGSGMGGGLSYHPETPARPGPPPAGGKHGKQGLSRSAASSSPCPPSRFALGSGC